MDKGAFLTFFVIGFIIIITNSTKIQKFVYNKTNIISEFTCL